MAYKLVTLNIQSDVHLDLVCGFLGRVRPDVLCLQEVYQADLSVLQSVVGFNLEHVAVAEVNKPLPNMGTPKGKWGVAIGTRFPVSAVRPFQYRDLSQVLPIPEKEGPGHVIPSAIAIQFVADATKQTVVSTHFTWSANATISPQQISDAINLKKYLTDNFPDYILCGDFNAPRGKTLYTLLQSGLTDNLPKDITTTIDENFHYAGKLDLVVDTIFSTPEYQVSQVEVVGGMSDHKALVAQVEKIQT